MFKQEDTPVPATSHKRAQTIIGDGTSIRGELKVDGDLRVDGKVDGTINVSANVTIGKTGVVKADLEVGSAEIIGSMTGKVCARERLVLQGGSRLEGDVQAQSFRIEDGAFFQGNCVMGNRRGSHPATSESEKDGPGSKLAGNKAA